MPGGLPSLDLPPFSTNYDGVHYTFMDMIRNFGGIVAFCPLIALLEHMAIAKAFSKHPNNLWYILLKDSVEK